MPSKSKKQHNLMAAVANNPKFAKKVGIPQSVGEDYVEADEGRKFRSGGMAGCGTKRMKAGGKIAPMKKAPPKTALEQTSPKSAAALNALEKKQRELATRNMLRDELGSKLDDPSFRVEMGGKEVQGLKKGGCVGDGCAIRGRTKGRMV
jgi:hypothetical protein